MLRSKIADGNQKILIHISNFRKVKRVNDVIRVFSKIKKKIPIRLMMIGDGPERIEAEQLCRTLNVSEDVRFMGKVKSVKEFLSISDLFILPSETESFGLVALEAMSSGIPVISTNSGGLPEVNIDNETGFLVNVGDLDAMVEKCLYLLSDEKKLTLFKENAYNHSYKFDLPKILPLYERLYNNLCSKK